MITGELGAGKTSTAYVIGKWFDPGMAPARVVYYGSDYMKVVRGCAATSKRWGQSWAQFEEPNLNLGARDFSKLINKNTAGFVQASRSLGVNSSWPLPADILMDCNILRVAQIKIRITGRNDDYAWGVVHRIKPNEFGTSPRYFYPKMGTLKIANPYKDPRLAAELEQIEQMKQAFMGEFFQEDTLKEAEKEQREKGKKPQKEDYLAYVLTHPEEFSYDKNTGEFSYSDIQAGPKGAWNLGSTQASRIKNVAQKRMASAETNVETVSAAPQDEPAEAALGE